MKSIWMVLLAMVLGVMVTSCSISEETTGINDDISVSAKNIGGNTPVRLKYGTLQQYAVSGMSWSWTTIYAKAKVFPTAGSVQVRYLDGAGIWKETNMSVTGTYGNYKVYYVQAPYTTRFCLKYTVGSVIYWDNNDGSDYRLTSFQGVAGGNVMLSHATAKRGFQAGGGFTWTTSWIEGLIFVNNLSYNKKVGIRYTANGTTWTNIDATYAGTTNLGSAASWVTGVEVWKFRTPEYNLITTPSAFQFAIYYQNINTGLWYWDNNFNQNYSLNKANGTTIY